jgi:hypothetical protein
MKEGNEDGRDLTSICPSMTSNRVCDHGPATCVENILSDSKVYKQGQKICLGTFKRNKQ